MLCLVRQANAVVLEVQLHPKAKGQECLDKVCKMLGVIEVDYFGLQYTGSHGENLWLNMRNHIRKQVPGPAPYRLQLKVKFHVPPHLLLQETTRHQVYMCVKEDLVSGTLRVDEQQAIKFASLIAQAELGDIDQSSYCAMFVCYPQWLPVWLLSAREDGNIDPGYMKPNNCEDAPPSPGPFSENTLYSVCQAVFKAHMDLAGVKSSGAECQLLKEASKLEDFGVEYYSIRASGGESLRIGVKPHQVTIMDSGYNARFSIPYSCIRMATHTDRCFHLNYIDDNGEAHGLGYKAESCEAAKAIYRAVTEKHAFYFCETVRSAVTSQFIRDFRGTIVSLFNENTALGKNYVFDIRRTCREVYEHTRRALFQMETKVSQSQQQEQRKEEDEVKDLCQDLKLKLACLQDSMLCRICMDADVNTVFFPCRHVVCCKDCASLCDRCPLCRTNVEVAQHIYLPVLGRKEAVR